MNKSLYIAVLAGVVAPLEPAVAGPGGSCHFHGEKPASQAVVVDCANQRREALVATGKLDKGWQAVKLENAELVDGKKGKEWRVTFRNPDVKDKAKDTLYIFFTAPGNFIAANFSGH